MAALSWITRCVSPASRSTHATATSTPSGPSKAPASRTESRWEPISSVPASLENHFAAAADPAWTYSRVRVTDAEGVTHDGPGIVVIWRGLARLTDIELGAEFGAARIVGN